MAVCTMLIVFRVSRLLQTLKHIETVFKKGLDEAGKTRPSNLHFGKNTFFNGEKGMYRAVSDNGCALGHLFKQRKKTSEAKRICA